MACCCCLATLGFGFFLYIIYRIYNLIYEILYPFYIAKPIDLRKAAGGKWAVITGATDGIGKGYAFELARKGFSIVLISRSESKLNMVKAELMKETNVDEVKIIVFDFSSQNVADYEEKILSILKKLDVGILVNNVGASFDHLGVLHEHADELQKMTNMITINTLSVTLLSAALLPQMVERNRGIIVNVSSGGTYQVMKASNVYASTKAYMSWLTKIMQREYAKTDIIIQLVCPFVVITNMSKPFLSNMPPLFKSETVENYAKYAVRSIGLISETTGCPSHQLQAIIPKIMPSCLDKWADDLMDKYRNEAKASIKSKKSD